MLSLHFAPVQGHTDAAYRHFHSEIYGGEQTYYTPFIRLEKEGIRPRDIKDISSDLNDGIHLVPHCHIYMNENIGMRRRYALEPEQINISLFFNF